MPRYFRSDGAETLGFPADELGASFFPVEAAGAVDPVFFSEEPVEASLPKIIAEAFGTGFSQGL